MRHYRKDQLDYIVKFSLGMLEAHQKQEVLEFILSKYNFTAPNEVLLLAEEAYYRIKQLEYSNNYRETLINDLVEHSKFSLWYKLKNIFRKRT